MDISGPPSFVFWYRDDNVVNYSDQSGVRIVTQSMKPLPDYRPASRTADRKKPVVVSSLYIDTVTPKDAGTYTCAPSNARNHSVVVHVIKGKKDSDVEDDDDDDDDEDGDIDDDVDVDDYVDK